MQSSNADSNRVESPLTLRLRLLLHVLAGIGLVLSAGLVWATLRKGTAGCGPSTDCMEVLTSRWSTWLGIPVALPAAAVYLGMQGALLFLRPPVTARTRNVAWGLLVVLVGLTLGAAIWFTGVQLVVLQRVCLHCMAAHCCAVCIGAMLYLPVRRSGLLGQSTPVRRSGYAVGAGLLVLVAGQTLTESSTHTSHPMDMPETASVNRSEDSGRTPTGRESPESEDAGSRPLPSARESDKLVAADSSGTARTLDLHDSQFRLHLDALPLLGSKQAPLVAVSFFDYTCAHCRNMHFLLMQAVSHYAGKLAVVTLPVPMDSRCNDLVAETPPRNANACKYAGVSLAVWFAKPEAFPSFSDWLFRREEPPDLAQTKREAERILGSEGLQAALRDRRISLCLKDSLAIYARNVQVTGKHMLPQFIVGSRIIVGVVKDAESLYRILDPHVAGDDAQ